MYWGIARSTVRYIVPLANCRNIVRQKYILDCSRRFASQHEGSKQSKAGSAGIFLTLLVGGASLSAAWVLLGHGIIGQYEGEPGADRKRRGKKDEAAAGKAAGALPLVAGKVVEKEEKQSFFSGWTKKKETAAPAKKEKILPKLPEYVPYLIIGSGTAGFSASRAVRAGDAEAKVLIIGAEEDYPYYRPPLSKDLWNEDPAKLPEKLKVGGTDCIFWEKEEFFCSPDKLDEMPHGGIALLRGWKVVRLDTPAHLAYLEDGTKIKYGKCCIATGGRPRNLDVIEHAGPEVTELLSLYRTVPDFRTLHDIAKRRKTVAIIGGGFLGSELAYSLAHFGKDSGLKVTQIFPEAGNMGRVLPEYLSDYTTECLREVGVTVKPNAVVQSVARTGDQLSLTLDNGEKVAADHVVVAVGLEPNVDLAKPSHLEVDPEQGGFRVDAELRARTDVWVAGDCCCFYDIKLGRRRVEHHDHAKVSGQLAGDNMTGAGKPYWHQSYFWSDIGPKIGYTAIGLIDSSLKTAGVYAKGDASSEKDKYEKGVVFYLKGAGKKQRIVGLLLWNLEERIPIARKILKEDTESDGSDEYFSELAKMFNLHGAAPPADDDAQDS